MQLISLLIVFAAVSQSPWISLSARASHTGLLPHHTSLLPFVCLIF